MKDAKTNVVAFDGRYINDRYHGIGRHAYNLLDALTQLDSHRRYLVFFNPDYPNSRFPLDRLRERPNVDIQAIQLPLYSPQEQTMWPRLLARAGADIFHSPYVVLPLLAHVKSIITVHDLIFEQYPEYRSRSFLQQFYQPVTRLCVKRANRILTVSEATAHDILKYYARKNVSVIGNAIDPTFRRESDPERVAAVRKRYGLPENFILTVGAGRPHKNVEVLVKAFALLDPALAGTLVIGGERDTRFPDTVGMLIDAHDISTRVKRIGMIREEDLPTVYSLARVFVFPSLVEGFGLPPLEAMACGTPVLASKNAAVVEAVGHAALTFDAHDFQQLANILKTVLSSNTLLASLVQCGQERVIPFTWEQVARKTLKVYAELENIHENAFYAVHS